MDKLNKLLRIIFVFTAAIFVMLATSLPKTNCQACELEHKGEKIDGYEAYGRFEEACISYDKPTDFNNIDLDDIVVNFTEGLEKPIKFEWASLG